MFVPLHIMIGNMKRRQVAQAALLGGYANRACSSVLGKRLQTYLKFVSHPNIIQDLHPTKLLALHIILEIVMEMGARCFYIIAHYSHHSHRAVGRAIVHQKGCFFKHCLSIYIASQSHIQYFNKTCFDCSV